MSCLYQLGPGFGTQHPIVKQLESSLECFDGLLRSWPEDAVGSDRNSQRSEPLLYLLHIVTR